MGESPRGYFSGSFSTFEQESFKGQAWADVLLEIAERVVRKLDQPGPPALLAARARQHPLAQLDLPACDREEGGILRLAFRSPPGHLTHVQLGRHLETHIGGGS